MKKRHIITLMLCLLALWGKPHRVAAQFFSAKVNALAALTATVNVGVDAAVADKWTLDLSAYWNPVNSDSFSCRLYAAQIGTKRWLYEAFVGHFIGSQLTYGNYLYGGSRHPPRPHPARIRIHLHTPLQAVGCRPLAGRDQF